MLKSLGDKRSKLRWLNKPQVLLEIRAEKRAAIAHVLDVPNPILIFSSECLASQLVYVLKDIQEHFSDPAAPQIFRVVWHEWFVVEEVGAQVGVIYEDVMDFVNLLVYSGNRVSLQGSVYLLKGNDNGNQTPEGDRSGNDLNDKAPAFGVHRNCLPLPNIEYLEVFRVVTRNASVYPATGAKG